MKALKTIRNNDVLSSIFGNSLNLDHSIKVRTNIQIFNDSINNLRKLKLNTYNYTYDKYLNAGIIAYWVTNINSIFNKDMSN